MKNSIQLSDFRFQFVGYGHYTVTYTSPKTGRSWLRTTNDMTLIDATKNTDEPKKKDLHILRRFCKQ